MAITALRALTTMPATFGSTLLTIVFADSPAELVAKKLVVIVESTNIIIPVTPRPAIE